MVQGDDLAAVTGTRMRRLKAFTMRIRRKLSGEGNGAETSPVMENYGICCGREREKKD
jgi:hypothetical protein